MTLERALQKASTDAAALVTAWKLNPHPRIAAVIGLLPGSIAFSGLFDGQLAEVANKIAALKPRRDPQLSNALERVLREPPWSSNTSRSVWAQIFALVTASKDPRFVSLAKELPEKWAMRSAQKEWMTRALVEATSSLPALTELTSEESALLQVVEREAYSSRPAPKRSSTIDFAAVYAAPADDAPRLVLADALLEQGEPRGEFLSLQLRTKKSPAETKREKALLKEHGPHWLTPFGPTLGAKVEWRRGFPAVGLVKFRDAAQAEQYGALPEWATFESLTWSPARSPEHVEAAGFIGPAFRHLLRADEVHIPPLLGGTHWALTWVRGSVTDPEGLAAVLSSPGLTKLTSLHLTDNSFTAEWIKNTQRWGSLQELGVASRYPPLLLHFLAAAEASPLARFQWGESLRFHRAADGSLTMLELLNPLGSYRVEDQLRTLPEGAISALVEPATKEWSSGPVGEALKRVIKKSSKRPSLGKTAALHLGLNGVRSMAWVQGKVLVSDGAVLRTVDAKTLEVVGSSENGGLLDPAGRDVLIQERERIVLRDLATSAQRTVLQGKGFEGLTRSVDGTRAAVMKNSKIRVFSVATGEVCFECAGRDPALDARGLRLSVTQAAVEVHDLETKTKEVLPGGMWTPMFLADHRLAQRASLEPVRVWMLGGKVLELPTTKDHAWEAYSTADGSRIAIVQPSSTQVFDGKTGKSLGKYAGGWAGIFAPDGTFFVAANDRLTRVEVRP